MGRRSVVLPVLDAAAKVMLLRGRSLAEETFLARAAALPGPSALQSDIVGGLQALLSALQQDAGLSPFGVLAARWDIDRFLTNLERLAAEAARTPTIHTEPIAAPLVVTGLPRSGTTFLHGLLAEDPENQTIRCWQAVHPYPQAGSRKDARVSRVARQLRWFGLLAPSLRSIHPLDSQAPQECTEVTAHVFQSLRFETTHDVPSYRAWLDRHGHDCAYHFHRRFLQHLQHQHGRQRWALKCPDHVFALGALHAAYPDARVVFVHRDPLKVLPSVANLTDVLRAPFALRTDPAKIGRQVLRDWSRGADIMIAAGRGWSFGSPEPFHVQYNEIVAEPLETVRRLYRHFGLTLQPAALERIAGRASAKPDGGYGRNVYNPAEYGLDVEEMRETFRGYMDHFDVTREVRPASGTPGQGGRPTWASPLRPHPHAGS